MTPATTRPRVLLTAARQGALAGLAGVAAMTVMEKLEQAATGRPDSYVPGRTLKTLLTGSARDDEQSLLWNHAMHWGTGAVVGALRGVWAVVGLRGPRAHLAHTAVRVHGGVGIDTSHPLHRYFLRAKQNEFALGSATAALRRIGHVLAAEPA